MVGLLMSYNVDAAINVVNIDCTINVGVLVFSHGHVASLQRGVEFSRSQPDDALCLCEPRTGALVGLARKLASPPLRRGGPRALARTPRASPRSRQDGRTGPSLGRAYHGVIDHAHRIRPALLPRP